MNSTHDPSVCRLCGARVTTLVNGICGWCERDLRGPFEHSPPPSDLETDEAPDGH